MSYAYNCEMYCDDCAECIKNELSDDTGDTNEYPQYAHSDESDSPQHCADCGEFLENDLTDYGREYLREAVIGDIENGHLDSVAITVWLPYYGVDGVGECANCGKISIVDSDDLCSDCE